MADYSQTGLPTLMLGYGQLPEPAIRAGVRELAAARASTSRGWRRVLDVSPDERFEALFREHYAAVLRFARRRTDPQTAEDVTAETFAIAWRRLDRVPAHKPLPWLYVTAGHELANRRRKAASDRDKAAALEHDVGRDPAEPTPSATPSCRPSPCSPHRDREALRLIAWEGLSLADGARAAGATRVAFAVRVSRARRRLAAALEDDPAPLRPLEIS